MRLDWHSVRIELREPLRISRATMSSRDAVCVTLTDRSTRGRGEVVTSPRLGIIVESIDRALRRAAAWLDTERDPRRLRARLPELRAELPDALPVVAAVDAAVHDYLAIRARQPLAGPVPPQAWDRLRECRSHTTRHGPNRVPGFARTHAGARVHRHGASHIGFRSARSHSGPHLDSRPSLDLEPAVPRPIEAEFAVRTLDPLISGARADDTGDHR